MKRLALLASGTGSNVKNIINYFKESAEVMVDCVIVNRKEAGAREHAVNAGVEDFLFTKSDFEEGKVLELLQERGVTHLILAGFLLKIPTNLIEAYPNEILNVHPSLLPKYGGAGMYGMNVHRAVVAAGETKSGITVHLVNEIYDDGEVLAQFEVELDMYDNPEKVAAKVQELEQLHFPGVIEKYLNN